jgi:hypothetical protein
MNIINFENLENRLVEIGESYRAASPFRHVIIDGFCDPGTLSIALDSLEYDWTDREKKSRDYIFAKNKFETPQLETLSQEMELLKDELLSSRFQRILQGITGEDIFIDPTFHGGGLHRGGEGSFLDMHVDFNYHPSNESWFRNVNLLLYLNRNWLPDWGGELKLQHLRDPERAPIEIAPVFNRLVIMETRDFTLHGYDPITFPSGEFRTSVAAYGYSLNHSNDASPRTTTWYPNNSGLLKKILGRVTPHIVQLKAKVLGSGTSRNASRK